MKNLTVFITYYDITALSLLSLESAKLTAAISCIVTSHDLAFRRDI